MHLQNAPVDTSRVLQGSEAAAQDGISAASASQITRHQSAYVASSHRDATSLRQSAFHTRSLTDSRRQTSRRQSRVRFSEDLDSSVRDGPVQTTTSERPRSWGLAVDTSSAYTEHYSHNESPEHAPPSPIPEFMPWTPPTPQGTEFGCSSRRNRSYSLRRAIFGKGTHSLAENTPLGPNAIELVEPDKRDADEELDLGKNDNFTENKTEVKMLAATHSSSAGSSVSLSDLIEGSKAGRFQPVGPSHEKWLRGKSTGAAAISRFSRALGPLRRFILRIQETRPSKNGRHIDLDPTRTEALIDERTGSPYVGNTIRSCRYSLWSFFPRQLFAQFTKLANFYFLVIAILQMIPGLSTTGTFTTIIPLMIFVGISMAKEGFDDWRRYRLDREENNRFAYVLRPSDRINTSPLSDSASISSHLQGWTAVRWKDIRVGDVIRVERNQPVPADLVLLHTDGLNGVAYIETMALDGETNLKSKQPSHSVAKLCLTVEDICCSSIHFTVEDPNMDLYKFDGNVTIGKEAMVPLTNTEVVYRGSVMRNTELAIGMAIYTGEECKIRMNANKNPRIKSPSLQAKVNRVVVFIVSLVVSLAVACTIAYKFWSIDAGSKAWYLESVDVSDGAVFTSFLIMFNTMIPISLYVSMEIVKVAQMFLLNDIDMYDEETDTPLEARTSTINEELGQVSYIFSDKTGTLTNNSMRFRCLSVAGTAWLHDFDLREEAAKGADRTKLIHKNRTMKGKKVTRRRSKASESRIALTASMQADYPAVAMGISKDKGKLKLPTGYRTTDMIEYIQRKPHTLFALKAKLFLLSIALCHTCIPEDNGSGQISFQAASPDELALVTAAHELGYIVIGREPNTLTVRQFTNGSEKPFNEIYEIMDVIEFSSARKRMSVVVRMPDQRICVFCKGADSAVMQLLKQSSLAQAKLAEVERRARRRKATEATEVIRRNSEYYGKDSASRSTISRHSLSYRDPSTSGDRGSVRRSIDVWLRERESDGGTMYHGSSIEHYRHRLSSQLAERNSFAFSDQGESSNDDCALVEESLVANEATVFERCFQHLNDFATQGLRTLMYGHRFVDEVTYENWKRAYNDACTSIQDRQEKIEKIGGQIENQLELTGATAIEDKLQNGVPEAVDKLRRANIKMWMLTGDKRETAINVGYSCRLVKDYSTVLTLDREVGGMEQSIAGLTADIIAGRVAHSVVVIDGQTLSSIKSNETLNVQFFKLAVLVDSVICCRASPKQKAFLVKSIRTRVNDSVTLAIGDGANDIAMIQEAHVGIGIAGKEGMQAARIADYSLAQFRFLLKLLLVHGRWNYIRVCKYTLGTFWKEMLFYLTQALFQHWNGYTGTSLYEPWSLSMFNTLFTSLAVIFLGIFTKDLSASTLLAVPELYTKGQRRDGFSIRLYLGWSLMATCEAVIIYFTMFGLFGRAIINMDSGIFPLGLLTFTACVVVINTKLQVLEVHNKTYISLAVIIISVGGWFLWNMILSARYKLSSGKGVYNVPGNFIHKSGRNLLFWAVLLISVMAVVVFEITVSTLRALFFPTDVDVFQELERDLDIRKRFEEAAASELQQGWNRGKRKSSLEIAQGAGEPESREQQIEELLSRPRIMSKSPLVKGVEMAEVELDGPGEGEDEELPRGSVEVQELLRRGFGSIRRGHLA